WYCNVSTARIEFNQHQYSKYGGRTETGRCPSTKYRYKSWKEVRGVMFSIDNTNTDGLGLYFRRDSIYNELGKLPKPKERFYNDWIDEHGKDYDTQAPTVYESLQYDIQCYLVAEGVADFQEKRASLLEILSRPEGFTLF